MDEALADAARRSGEWLKCAPGCTQCCVGVFAISQLDAVRLRVGMVELEASEPTRAARVRARARQSWKRLKQDFPGDHATGVLDEGAEAEERFEEFANDEPCPALDPATGLCDLYSARPMTCRVFGPPVRTEEGLGVCELCFNGASPEEVKSCEMQLPSELEARLKRQVERKSGAKGQTIVAWCLAERA